MKSFKHGILHGQQRRPNGRAGGRPNAQNGTGPHSLIAVDDGVEVCLLIGPDGHDLNHQPLVGKGRKVRLQFREGAGDAIGVGGRRKKRLTAAQIY